MKSRDGKMQRRKSEKQVREEQIKEENVRRKKMRAHKKVGRPRGIVFSKWFVAPEGRKVGPLKRRVRSQLARWEMNNCSPLRREAHVQVKMYQTSMTLLAQTFPVLIARRHDKPMDRFDEFWLARLIHHLFPASLNLLTTTLALNLDLIAHHRIPSVRLDVDANLRFCSLRLLFCCLCQTRIYQSCMQRPPLSTVICGTKPKVVARP